MSASQVPMVIDAFVEAYKLDVVGLSNEKVREIFRTICYRPRWSDHRQDIGFRELRMLQHFGHCLELAYYSRENWAIVWPSALMLIAKYRLLEGQP